MTGIVNRASLSYKAHLRQAILIVIHLIINRLLHELRSEKQFLLIAVDIDQLRVG